MYILQNISLFYLYIFFHIYLHIYLNAYLHICLNIHIQYTFIFTYINIYIYIFKYIDAIYYEYICIQYISKGYANFISQPRISISCRGMVCQVQQYARKAALAVAQIQVTRGFTWWVVLPA